MLALAGRLLQQRSGYNPSNKMSLHPDVGYERKGETGALLGEHERPLWRVRPACGNRVARGKSDGIVRRARVTIAAGPVRKYNRLYGIIPLLADPSRGSIA